MENVETIKIAGQRKSINEYFYYHPNKILGNLEIIYRYFIFCRDKKNTIMI